MSNQCPNSETPKGEAVRGDSFEFRHGPAESRDGQGTVGGLSSLAQTICPKCGRPSWAPYVMPVKGKYGQVYRYLVYRHPDGRRKTPRKHTVKLEGEAQPGGD
jgi:hypothetical protein